MATGKYHTDVVIGKQENEPPKPQCLCTFETEVIPEVLSQF